MNKLERERDDLIRFDLDFRRVSRLRLERNQTEWRDHHDDDDLRFAILCVYVTDRIMLRS